MAAFAARAQASHDARLRPTCATVESDDGATGTAGRSFDRLAISSLGVFVFGRSPTPVDCGHGVTVGAGRVVPELNFTLKPRRRSGSRRARRAGSISWPARPTRCQRTRANSPPGWPRRWTPAVSTRRSTASNV